jgi:hypothetical protein
MKNGIWKYFEGSLQQRLQYEWKVQVRYVGTVEWVNREWTDQTDSFATQLEAHRELALLLPVSEGSQWETRVVARLVGVWQAQTKWIPTRVECPVCTHQVSIREDLRFVSHGRLVSASRDAQGRVQRSSEPCEGSGALV